MRARRPTVAAVCRTLWLTVFCSAAAAQAPNQDLVSSLPAGLPDGSYYAAFVRSDGQIQTCYSPTAGATWPEELRVTHPDTTQFGVGIAPNRDDDSVALAYVYQVEAPGSPNDGTRKLVVKRGAGPTSWLADTPSDAARVVSIVDAPAITHLQGQQYLVALNPGGNEGPLMTMVYDDSTYALGALAAVPPATANDRHPQLGPGLLATDKYVLLAWLSDTRTVGLGDTHVVHTAVSPTGLPLSWTATGTDGAPLPLPAGHRIASVAPAVAVTDGKFLLAVTTVRSTGDVDPVDENFDTHHLLTFASEDAGASWELVRHCFLAKDYRVRAFALAAGPRRSVGLLERGDPESDLVALGPWVGVCPDPQSEPTVAWTWLERFGRDGAPGCRPAVAFDHPLGRGGPPGYLVAATVNEQDQRMVTHVSRDGETWDHRVAHREQTLRGPGIAAHPRQKRLVLAWFQPGDAQLGARLRLKTGDGATQWSAPVEDLVFSSSQSAPAISHLADDRYVLVWNTGQGIWYAVYDDATGVLDPADQFVAGLPVPAQGAPTVASNGQVARLMWVETADSTGKAQLLSAEGAISASSPDVGASVSWTPRGRVELPVPLPLLFEELRTAPCLQWTGADFLLTTVMWSADKSAVWAVHHRSADGSSWTWSAACRLDELPIPPHAVAGAIGPGGSVVITPPTIPANGRVRSPITEHCLNVLSQRWQDDSVFRDRGRPGRSAAVTVLYADSP
jgi:hypothetical protein